MHYSFDKGFDIWGKIVHTGTPGTGTGFNIMTTTSALSEAQTTCDGLQRLIQRINEAAVDIDKGGGSSYEILALIASANTCVVNLGTQLTILESDGHDNSNVHPIKRDTQIHEQNPDNDNNVKIAKQ